MRLEVSVGPLHNQVMAIRKIARMGHPVLRQQTRDLTREELKSESFRQLLQDMVDTMEEYGGIGLAAPQIHESLNLAIIDYDDSNPRYTDAQSQDGENFTSMPLSVFINPRVTALTEETQSYWEGCLSVPEMRGLVTRPKKVRIDYWDVQGNEQSLVAEGFLATVFQHELDHLIGVLYVDRIGLKPGANLIAFTEEYQRYLVPREGSGVGELKD